MSCNLSFIIDPPQNQMQDNISTTAIASQFLACARYWYIQI